MGARFARTSRNARTFSYISDAPEYETSGSIEIEAIVTLQPFGGSLSATTLRHANVRRIELEVRNSDIDFGAVEAWEPGYSE